MKGVQQSQLTRPLNAKGDLMQLLGAPQHVKELTKKRDKEKRHRIKKQTNLYLSKDEASRYLAD